MNKYSELVYRSIQEAFRPYNNRGKNKLVNFSFQFLGLSTIISAVYAFIIYWLVKTLFGPDYSQDTTSGLLQQSDQPVYYKLIYTWAYFFTLHSVFYACYLLDHSEPEETYTFKHWWDYVSRTFPPKIYLLWAGIILLVSLVTFTPFVGPDSILKILFPRVYPNLVEPNPFLPGQGIPIFLLHFRDVVNLLADLLAYLLPVYATFRIAYRRYNLKACIHTSANRYIYFTAAGLGFVSGASLSAAWSLFRTYCLALVWFIFREPLIYLAMGTFLFVLIFSLFIPFTMVLNIAPFYITRTPAEPISEYAPHS